MPTPPRKHRTYCKNCQDFTIHSWATKEDLLCDTCGTKDSGYNLSQVKTELLLQQRERYNQSKLKNLGGLYGAFMKGVGIEALMELNNIRQDIVECDAGQKQIDEDKRLKSAKIREEVQKILDDYNNNYKHLNRNDKCSCGSNKKYKQCHLITFREKGVKI